MLNLIFAAALTLLPQAAPPRSDEPAVPSPAEVKIAVEELKAAFKKGGAEERVAAIKEHSKVIDGKVVDGIAKGLKDKEVTVKLAAIEALRWMPHPGSLKSLHKSLEKDKKIRKDARLYAALVKAIGQHGSPDSIDPLMDGALAASPAPVSIARIYSLGHIRDIRSVEALMKILQSTGGAGKQGQGKQPFMDKFAVSLEVLTGEKFGAKEEVWLKWWRKSKKTFEVNPKPGKLTPQSQKIWTKYWSAPKGKDTKRDKEKRKRGDRGTGDANR